MTKTITICFRTSEHLRNALEKISVEERRTMSSTIENILYKFIGERNEFKCVQNENRRYPRKSVSVPALLSFNSETSAGIVLMSLLVGYRFQFRAVINWKSKKMKRIPESPLCLLCQRLKNLLACNACPNISFVPMVRQQWEYRSQILILLTTRPSRITSSINHQ